MLENNAQELVEKLEKFRKTLVGNKKASKDILVKAGIISENGILKARYKHLCIPQEQA